MIRYISTKAVVIPGALYVLFDILWLLAANSRGVSDSSRPLLKALCIAGASVVYILTASIVATQASDRWALRTSLSSASALLVGVFVMMVVSWIVWRGQFFHDAELSSQLPALLLLLVLVPLGGGLIASLLGAFARAVMKTGG